MVNSGSRASASPGMVGGANNPGISGPSREVNGASDPNDASDALSIGGSSDSAANILSNDFMNTFPAGALDDILNDSDEDNQRMQHLSWEAKYYVSSSSVTC